MLSLAVRRGSIPPLRLHVVREGGVAAMCRPASRSPLSMSSRTPSNMPRPMQPGPNPRRDLLSEKKGSTSLSAISAVALLVGGNVYGAYRITNCKSKEEAKLRFFNSVTSLKHLQAGLLHTPITSTFTHATYSSLLLSTGAIAWFGGDVARAIGAAIGARRFLGAYAMCGAASAVVAAWEQQRNGRVKPIFGASGAVNGIVVLYMAIQRRVTAAPLAYLFVKALDTSFLTHKDDDPGRRIGHASGLAWGGIYALYLNRGLRLVL